MKLIWGREVPCGVRPDFWGGNMIILDLVLIIAGLLLYGFASAKLAEVGRILFAFALLAFLLAGHVPVLR